MLWIYKFIDLFFPNTCRICANPLYSLTSICSVCIDGVDKIEGPTCETCGLPAAEAGPGHEAEFKAGYCPGCWNDAATPLDSVISFAYYNDNIKKIIHLFKYNSHTSLAQKLSGFLAECAKRLPAVDMVTYVPLYSARLKEREFNQSYLLAFYLSSLLGVKTVRLLDRVKDTPSQSRLDGAQRRQNVKSAFRLVDISLPHGKTILLVDDVCTTGSTLRECALELRKATPRAVYAVTLAMSV